MLALSRLMLLIPVVFLLLDAAGSFVYGSDILVRSATGVIGEPAKIGGRLGLFLIVMDTFLVGATLMIVAFGFYELFIIKSDREGRRYWLPNWLKMHDLEDLKARVVSMLILVAAITFVDRTVEAHNQQEVLFLGIGISIIIAALTAFLWFGKRRPPAPGPAANAASEIPPVGSPEPTAVPPRAATSPAPAATSPPARPADPSTAASGLRAPAASPSAAVADPSAAVADPSAPVADPSALPYLAAPTTSPAGPAQPAAGPAQPAAAMAPDIGAPGDARLAPGATAPHPAVPARRRRARVMALLGSSRGGGDWNASGRTDVIAFAGWARIDLTDADVRGEGLKIRVISVFGLVSIAVPPEMAVADSGLALLGSRSVRGGTAAPGTAGTPGTPGLVLSGACVLGAVRVRRQP